MQFKIKKAVFPVAGFGTRFLPATKANPKEMLPIVDKPLIQYAVEEAISAGITQLIFVTSSSKRAIEDHFDSNFELESILVKNNKTELLRTVQNILPKGVECVYIRQTEQLGLGHAVYCAKEVVGDEPFAVLLADDLIVNHKKTCLQQMMEIYNKNGDNVLAVQQISANDVDKYGIVALDANDNSLITNIVEKPSKEQAPSQLAVVGRYILGASIFEHLANIHSYTKGELQLTDGIASMLSQNKIRVCPFHGVRYDCGNKLGYVKATVECALDHREIGAEFRSYLRRVISELIR